jgi:hypothetical protein
VNGFLPLKGNIILSTKMYYNGLNPWTRASVRRGRLCPRPRSSRCPLLIRMLLLKRKLLQWGATRAAEITVWQGWVARSLSLLSLIVTMIPPIKWSFSCRTYPLNFDEWSIRSLVGSHWRSRSKISSIEELLKTPRSMRVPSRRSSLWEKTFKINSTLSLWGRRNK